jgi:hypothetical protein
MPQLPVDTDVGNYDLNNYPFDPFAGDTTGRCVCERATTSRGYENLLDAEFEFLDITGRKCDNRRGQLRNAARDRLAISNSATCNVLPSSDSCRAIAPPHPNGAAAPSLSAAYESASPSEKIAMQEKFAVRFRCFVVSLFRCFMAHTENTGEVP